jgi:hypothetical protein
MFVLSEQLNTDGDPNLPFRRYAEYLRENRSRFPAAAYDLASSGLLLNATDPNCPHDGWLEWAKFEEPSEGDRHEIRTLSFRVCLLGAYHDRYIELFYPRIFAYFMSNLQSAHGHYDWCYSEIRLSDKGNIIHEIEWAGPPGFEAHWVIEASDVQLQSFPLLPHRSTPIPSDARRTDAC